jgi:hypothetical protein
VVHRTGSKLRATRLDATIDYWFKDSLVRDIHAGRLFTGPDSLFVDILQGLRELEIVGGIDPGV